MAKTNPKTVARLSRTKRVRRKISGTAERPRLCVFKSSRHMYAQLIDDVAGRTLVAMSTLDGTMKAEGFENKKDGAHKVGMQLAEKAKQLGVEKIVFDRGGYIYHGRVKSVSDGAREGGLIF